MNPPGDYVTVPQMTTPAGEPIYLNRLYDVQIPVQGELQWVRVCRCDTAESLASVVHALMRAPKHPPEKILIEVHHV